MQFQLHEPADDLEHDERGDIGEAGHVGDLEQRPFPTAGLAAHDRRGGKALRGEDVKHQQAGARRRVENRRAVGARGVAQRIVKRIGIFLGGFLAHAIDNRQRGNNRFARGERTQDADADLPVVTQRPDDGFDGVADVAGKGILQRILRGQAVGGRASTHPLFPRRRILPFARPARSSPPPPRAGWIWDNTTAPTESAKSPG